MTGEKTVSVVLPTYGRPEYFEEAVTSVVNQTYPAVELVVVDDCSPDPVAPLLDDVDTEAIDVKLVRHEENRGACAARNTGIADASGAYIAFIDDDDVWLPTKVARQVERFEDADDEVGVVYTGQQYVNEDGERTSVRTPTTSGDVTRDLFRGDSITPFSCLMVDADVVEKAGPVDERLPSWQDKEWYYRLSQHCHFASVPEPLVIRRMGHDQISGNYEAKRDVSYPLTLRKHRSLAVEYGCEDEFVADLSRSMAGSALRAGEYGDAVRFLATALRRNPADLGAWGRLFAAVGGPVTYPLAQKARRAYANWTSPAA
jgi:glycosyltransferase involved in cell wall biosynthesis